MKRTLWLVLGILMCVVVVVVAYFWATNLISSLYSFRSPLHSQPPQPGQKLGKPLTRKVVAVLIDAERVDTSLKPDVMPFLNSLRTKGAWATIHSHTPSYSAPGYSVLMTGAWPDVSDGPAMNPSEDPNSTDKAPTWTQDNVFSAAQRAGLKTAVSGYFWFKDLIPQQSVTTSFYTPGADASADVDVMNAALPWLDQDYQFILIHIDQVDYAGHFLGGPVNPSWAKASSQADAYLREIASHLDLKQDTLLVFSDHGQINRGGHGGQDPIVLIEPFVMAGAGVHPGHYPDIYQVDIAPTIATLLGTNIPASNQGHVLKDMLVLPSAEDNIIQSAVADQQAQLATDYITAIGRKPSQSTLQPGQNPVDFYQTAMLAAKQQRRTSEYLWRIPLVLLIAILPILIMVIRKDKKVLWLLAGGLLYALFFNLRYAVLSQRTYSLSSVASQTDIILYTAITAAAALLAAWVVTMLVLRGFGKGAFQAAWTSLTYILMVLYLLFLPVLISVALNGFLITWTMPDFLTMFLGFLSILQMLVVAAVGLVLTGIAAGIGQLSTKRTRLTAKQSSEQP